MRRLKVLAGDCSLLAVSVSRSCSIINPGLRGGGGAALAFFPPAVIDENIPTSGSVDGVPTPPKQA